MALLGPLRFLRIFRLFRISRYNTGLRILVIALKASGRELGLLLSFIFIGMVIFATFMYFAEFDMPYNFPNIPIGFYWAIITMTTVGYGDYRPKSPLGFVVGSVCALCGMLATNLPIPIIANNFSLYYSYVQMKTRLDRRQQKVDNSLKERAMKKCGHSEMITTKKQIIEVGQIETVRN